MRRIHPVLTLLFHLSGITAANWYMNAYRKVYPGVVLLFFHCRANVRLFEANFEAPKLSPPQWQSRKLIQFLSPVPDRYINSIVGFSRINRKRWVSRISRKMHLLNKWCDSTMCWPIGFLYSGFRTQLYPVNRCSDHYKKVIAGWLDWLTLVFTAMFSFNL